MRFRDGLKRPFGLYEPVNVRSEPPTWDAVADSQDSGSGPQCKVTSYVEAAVSTS